MLVSGLAHPRLRCNVVPQRLHNASIPSVQGKGISDNDHFTHLLNTLSPCRMDVKESNDSNTVTATFELPGLKSEEVAIDLRQNRLTVSGESSTSHADEKDGYTVRERRHGKFSRTLQLPIGTKASRA